MVLRVRGSIRFETMLNIFIQKLSKICLRLFNEYCAIDERSAHVLLLRLSCGRLAHCAKSLISIRVHERCVQLRNESLGYESV